MATRRKKPVAVVRRSDGRVKCPVCEAFLEVKVDDDRLPAHTARGASVACPYSNREINISERSPSGRDHAARHKVKRTEELRKEKEQAEKRKQRDEEHRRRSRARRNRQSLSDRYALELHDTWGIDDHSVDPGVSVRTYRGGLPGQGRRS